MLNTRIQQIISSLSEKTYYPYVPLALGVALLGLLHLFSVLDPVMAMHQHLNTPGSLRHELIGVNLADIVHFSFSVFVLMVAFGLWFRSRISWLLSVVSLIVGIIYTMQSQTSIEVWFLFYKLVLLGLLVTSRKNFNRQNMRLDTFSALISVIVLFCYAVFGTYSLGDQFSPHVDTLIDAFYVSVITITTVGYGDFSPVTVEARLFVVSTIIFSISVLSTAIGATLIPALIQKIKKISIEKEERMNRTNHYIIVGYSALSANTYIELSNRKEHITVILKNQPDGALFADKDIDLIIGDGSDAKVLLQAGAENAKAILALLDDDSENAFVILAAKELQVKAKTVAAVNSRYHLHRIRRVHPDMILAPQVLGGELLTSMLVGERIDINSIMSHLLGQTETNDSSDAKK